MLKRMNVLFLIVILKISAQSPEVYKIEPPNWWTGMRWNNIQLMIYGKNLNGIDAVFNSSDIKIKSVHNIENKSYAFVDIEVSDKLKAGKYYIALYNIHGEAKIEYDFWERQSPEGKYSGFNRSDAIYLIMPDRFVNGNTRNDFAEGYIDSMQHIPAQQRKGGDLQGVIDKLGYIKELGFTTIWLTPVTENNTFRSYHGYATTNHYLVDPRLGSNDLYGKLVDEAHKKGLKIIFDHVANHISADHPWMKNLPAADWINGSIEKHLPANHNKMLYSDPYADSSSIEQVYKGWFVSYMPDLNQKNKFVANYLIQNTLWWIEYAGLDGIREDTYPYAEPNFMSRWSKIILEEYPSFNIVGEVWTGEPAFLSTYQSGSKTSGKTDTYLPSITDFALRDQLVKYLQGTGSLYQIFNVIAKDNLYKDPSKLVTFIDNHDMGRAMYFAGGDIKKAKLAFHMLLTLRGIPQIFYGSEIGMTENEDHGTLRKPFPGGWPGDRRDAFTPDGRTDVENEIYNYINQLLLLRKKYKTITDGKLTHFPPDGSTYVYFKSFNNEHIVNIINDSNNDVEFDLSEYGNFSSGITRLINLKSDEKIIGTKVMLEARKAYLFMLE
ncbi:MAG: cyclomaltodextrinase N-terminal domain-containing protein [Melioribacteraceae bacterium]|nr:cyclomaltodextrinase N-terminal domain-containing protein [Melioribacteraceae bacterium]